MTAVAQDTIRVCGAELHLGMSKAHVLELAAEKCPLKRVKGASDDTWTVRDGNDGLWNSLITFEGDSLTFVSQGVVRASGDEADDIVNKLYSFIRQAQSNGQSVAVSLEREVVFDDPDGDLSSVRLRGVSFMAGEKQLALHLTEAVEGKHPTHMRLGTSFDAVLRREPATAFSACRK